MYKVASIGSGTHGLLAILNPKMDTVAFCDISEKKRNDAVKIAEVLKDEMKADKEPTPVRGYADYREMIEKEKPDIVTIMTPNPLHADMSVFALEHGAHVFVEKPMCVSYEQCEQMVDAVRRTGLKLAVNQCGRTIQALQSVYDRKAAGRIGAPYYIRAEYLHGTLRPRLENPNDLSGQDPVLLGGGSHPIDLILGLMDDPPESVSANGSKFMTSPAYLHNDMMNVLIRFPGGKTGYVVTTHSCYRRGLGLAFELYATKADIIQTVTYVQGKEPSGLRVFDAEGGRSVYEFSDTQTEIQCGHGEGFYRQQENLLQAIEHDVKNRTMADVVDGARTVSVALAAGESARTGKSVPMRQWEPLTYTGTGPLWDLDDYQQDMLRAYAPVLSNENRKKILGVTEWSGYKHDWTERDR